MDVNNKLAYVFPDSMTEEMVTKITEIGKKKFNTENIEFEFSVVDVDNSKIALWFFDRDLNAPRVLWHLTGASNDKTYDTR